MIKQPKPPESTGLVKSIGVFTAITLVVGSMIGSGVFKKVAPMSEQLGAPEWIMLAWLIAGIITLLGALTNAEVAGLIAEPGGQYAYFKKMYGRKFAFLYGWSSFSVVQSATAASVAYVFAHSVNSFFPLPQLPESMASWSFGVHISESIQFAIQPFQDFGVKLVTIGLLTLLTTINYVGVKYGGWLTTIMASAIVICLFTIMILCLGFSGADGSNLNSTYAAAPAHTGWLSAMFTAMLGAFWAYEGWNTIGFLGGEIKDPYKTIPRSLVIGVGAVIIIYLLVNVSYLYVLPVDTLSQISGTEIAAVEVVRSFLGNGGALFISILIMCSTFNSTNTTIMGAPRIYFAMARDGVFSKKMAQTHPKFRTPGNALILQCFWSSLLVLSGNFDQLTDLLIFAAFIFYGAGAWGVFVLRKKMRDVPRPYKVYGYPWVPAIFVLFCFIFLLNTLITQPIQALVGLVLILMGLPFYYYWNRKYGH